MMGFFFFFLLRSQNLIFSRQFQKLTFIGLQTGWVLVTGCVALSSVRRGGRPVVIRTVLVLTGSL